MPRHGAHDFHGKNSKMKSCLDCPAKIPAYGNKDRCAACACDRYEMLKRARNERRKAERRAAKSGAT